MRVSELMTRDPLVAAPEWTVAKAIDRMAERAVRHLPVVERALLVGLVSERDLLEVTGWNPDHYVEADGAPRIVRDCMSVAVLTVAPDDDLSLALDLLLERRVGCLPVVGEGERLAGLLTVADLLEAHVRACAAAPGVGPLDSVVAARMSAPAVAVEADATVAAAIEACRAQTVRHLPVQDDGWFVGLVSDRDLRLRAGRGEHERRIAQVMSTDLATIGPESLLSDAAQLMLRRRVDAIPVAREGRLMGLVTTTDVLSALREGLDAAAGTGRATSPPARRSP